VLSQAFDQQLPILEANSRRVLCRLLAVRDNPQHAVVQGQLWRAAEELLPRLRVGAFNQALMELGALVCTPSRPACTRCPLAHLCRARQTGLEDSIPPRARRVRSVQVDEVAVVVERGSRVLLVRRPPEGRWGGMWEFPRIECEPMEPAAAAAERLLTALGLRGAVCGEVATIRHAVTRFRITLTCLKVQWRGGACANGSYAESRWVVPAALAEFPISTPQRRLAERLAPTEGRAPAVPRRVAGPERRA
jgi:A/G-specific adenine glycosylase